MSERQFVCLPSNGLGNFRAAISHIDAVEPTETVEALSAFGIPDVHAFRTGHDPIWGLASAVLGQMRGRMKDEASILLSELLGSQITPHSPSPRDGLAEGTRPAASLAISIPQTPFEFRGNARPSPTNWLNCHQTPWKPRLRHSPFP